MNQKLNKIYKGFVIVSVLSIAVFIIFSAEASTIYLKVNFGILPALNVSPVAIDIGESIMDYCSEKYEEGKFSYEHCLSDSVYNYIMNNITYDRDEPLEEFWMLDNNIEWTVQNGNDCEGITIAALSILKSMDVEGTYFVIQRSTIEEEYHACWMVTDSYGWTDTYNCFLTGGEYIITGVQKV